MTAFTPGPWACKDTSNHAHDYRLFRPDGSPLPVTAPANDHSEQRANARLIAAAPDMYAALDSILADLRERDATGSGLMSRAATKSLILSALAKARGEQ